MEITGLRDADVWAPLTGDGDRDLYDSEEEMGGSAVFSIGRDEEKNKFGRVTTTAAGKDVFRKGGGAQVSGGAVGGVGVGEARAAGYTAVESGVV